MRAVNGCRRCEGLNCSSACQQQQLLKVHHLKLDEGRRCYKAEGLPTVLSTARGSQRQRQMRRRACRGGRTLLSLEGRRGWLGVLHDSARVRATTARLRAPRNERGASGDAYLKMLGCPFAPSSTAGD
eukprot:6194835-Pleurochrysis_carterae.AAC.4